MGQHSCKTCGLPANYYGSHERGCWGQTHVRFKCTCGDITIYEMDNEEANAIIYNE